MTNAKETLTVTHDDLQKRLSQFKQIAEEAQAAYQQFSAGQPVRLDAEQIAATYRQLKAAYESVSGAAVELGVTIPEDWGNLVTGYQRMNDDRKMTATRRVDRSAASPLSYLVKSWLEQYGQRREDFEDPDDYSGIR
ncbi:MAG: hypothetical protein U0872_10920 [Planctomycetaceae bacterium]